MFDREDRAFRRMNTAQAEFLALVANVDETERWRAEGATSCSAWLRGRYGLTKATAVESVRVARALRSLPAIDAAARGGALSFEQLRPLTKFARADTDAELARRAPAMSAPELWDEARRHERVTVRDHAEVHRNRGLWSWWNEQRTELSGFFRLGAEQGTAFENAVADHSEQVVLADEPVDRTGARMADALVELVTDGGSGSGDRVVVVHADAAVLTGGEGMSETENGARILSETVRRLACDARIEWSLEKNGRCVGIGRQSRVSPPWLRRAVVRRDGCCVFPGCGRRRWVKIHHIRWWERDLGRTDLDNLVLLCHAHHRLVHEGGWSIRGRPDVAGDLRFVDARGREPLLQQGRFAA